jgi:hypothetical protein
MGWANLLARMWEKAYNVYARELIWRKPFGISWRWWGNKINMVLKYIQRVWTGLRWLRIGKSGWLF